MKAFMRLANVGFHPKLMFAVVQIVEFVIASSLNFPMFAEAFL